MNQHIDGSYAFTSFIQSSELDGITTSTVCQAWISVDNFIIYLSHLVEESHYFINVGHFNNFGEFFSELNVNDEYIGQKFIDDIMKFCIKHGV
jgi:hypothetical protein